MSGLEIIGVILTLVPIVSGGIDGYKRLRDGPESRQLERSFKTQHVIFLNTIEELICPLVSDSQLQTLLKDPNGRLWKDKQLSASLEKHLDGAYPIFSEIMEDIKVVMSELQKTLSAEVSVLCSDPRKSANGDKIDMFVQSLESRKVHRRIKLFLTRSRSEAGLERLRAKIADLEILKGQSQRLAPHRRVKSVKMESFTRVRERALSLYDALSRGWECACQDPHLANLRLEARRYVTPQSQSQSHQGVGGGEEEIRFKFLFSFCSPSADQTTGARSLDWHEAELAPLDHVDTTKPSYQEHNASRRIPANPRALGGVVAKAPQAQDTSTSEPHQTRALRFEFPKNPVTLNIRKGEGSRTFQRLEIKDLCQWIRNVQSNTIRPNEDCLGYLSDVNQLRYGLYRVTPRNDVEPPLASFHVGEPLSPTGSRGKGKNVPSKRQKFSNRTKTQLAFTLGSTILQLHSTPWLDKWKKQDILYFPEPGSDMVQQAPVQPYISRRFSSNMSRDGATVASSARAAPGFAPNETLFTLGVILIEIAYNKTIEALAEPSEKAQMAAVTQYVTAMRIRKEIGQKMGLQYQRAVDGCLMCQFGVQGLIADLKRVDFQRQFLEHVITPLEESMLVFSPEPCGKL